MSNFFKVLKRSNRSKARLGEITTSHGKIKTPAFVPVASKGTLKTLLPTIIKDIGIQTAFVNTYHLTTHPGVDLIEKAGGIHKFSRLNFPLMSDSGGFQVFSLAQNKRQADIRGDEQPLLVKISQLGVKFRSTYDGRVIEFTPEKSIEYQIKIGADILMAFDECTYYSASYEYTKKAMDRTHEWLKHCIIKKQTIDDRRSKIDIEVGKRKVEKKSQFSILHPQNLSSTFNTLSSKKLQALYGIIQGGMYEDLRKKSAEFVVSQKVDGVAIGGVSVGETKQEMRNQVGWVADYLPKDKPVHLLGIGQFDDILDLVKYGIDTFDCVEPTRLARMGHIYQISNHKLDILIGKYKDDLSPVDEHCQCYVCQNFTKAYLHHLFKQKEILGYSLATYHNLWVMERFFEKIRQLIGENKI